MTSWREGHPSGAGLLLALLALYGCGGTDATPVAPDVVGEFSGTWTQDLVANGESIDPVSCPCTVTVPRQSGNSFFGSSRLAAPCDRGLIAGQGRSGVLAIRDGRIESSGALSFRFTEDPGVGASGGGCTVTAMPAFTGSLSGGRITAQRTEAYDCRPADGNEYQLTVRLVASR